jgi:hypothetical protein
MHAKSPEESRRKKLDIPFYWKPISDHGNINRTRSRMSKINIDSALYERAKQAAAITGYSSIDEFMAHAIENELKRLKIEEAEQQVADQLRGLGYIE